MVRVWGEQGGGGGDWWSSLCVEGMKPEVKASMKGRQLEVGLSLAVECLKMYKLPNNFVQWNLCLPLQRYQSWLCSCSESFYPTPGLGATSEFKDTGCFQALPDHNRETGPRQSFKSSKLPFLGLISNSWKIVSKKLSGQMRHTIIYRKIRGIILEFIKQSVYFFPWNLVGIGLRWEAIKNTFYHCS